MKGALFIFTYLITAYVMGQNEPSVFIMDFVKIKDNNQKEALYFYENNWGKFRESALIENFIKAYKIDLVTDTPDAGFNILLATEYTDESQFKISEDNFQKVMKELNSNGPLFLNDKKPNDFRESAYMIKVKSEIGLDRTIAETSDIVSLNEDFSKFYISGDYEGLANAYSEDGFILPPGADIIQGREAIKKRWILPDGVTVPYHKIIPIEIQITHNFAFDIGYYEGRTIRKDSSEVTWKGKYLIIWKKEGGDWKIYADAWNRID